MRHHRLVLPPRRSPRRRQGGGRRAPAVLRRRLRHRASPSRHGCRRWKTGARSVWVPAALPGAVPRLTEPGERRCLPRTDVLGRHAGDAVRLGGVRLRHEAAARSRNSTRQESSRTLWKRGRRHGHLRSDLTDDVVDGTHPRRRPTAAARQWSRYLIVVRKGPSRRHWIRPWLLGRPDWRSGGYTGYRSWHRFLLSACRVHRGLPLTSSLEHSKQELGAGQLGEPVADRWARARWDRIARR